MLSVEELIIKLHKVSTDSGISTGSDRLTVILALSGGLDSVVLLHLLSKVQLDNIYIQAVYIDHQLQEESKTWVGYNNNICVKYGVDFNFYTVELGNLKDKSIEAAAREARYKAFAEVVDQPNKVLLTAQHQNDQAETFLLQLARGAGPKGLSSMPELKRFSKGWHLRPLLATSRRQLEQYAIANNLSWVEDKTNLELKFDRNFIRHSVLPLLEQRWPSYIASVANSANNCAEHELVLTQYLEQDYKNISAIFSIFNKQYIVLDINKLKEHTVEQQKLLIRYWLNKHNVLMPSKIKMQHILQDCILSKPDANPRVCWDKTVITKFKNKLFVLTDKEFNAEQDLTELNYKLGSEVYIAAAWLKISSVYDFNDKDSCELSVNEVIIKFRQDGEVCRPLNRNGSVKLKKLFQEKNIPIWYRSRVPLFYIDGEIACIPGVVNCQVKNKNISLENLKIDLEYL